MKVQIEEELISSQLLQKHFSEGDCWLEVSKPL